MKRLKIAISILFIMFAANCMGMEVVAQQEDSPPKPINFNEDNMILEKNIKFKKNIMNQDNLALTASKEQINNDDVAISKFETLFGYISSGDLEKFEELLKKKPGLKLRVDSEGNDALMVAAYYGREKFVKFLLSNETPYNMNLYAINDKDENALLVASSGNYINIVKLLIEKNPNIMQSDKNWKPAFIKACENKNWEIAEYLLNNFEPKKFEPKEDGRRSRYNKQVKYLLKELLYSIKELSNYSSEYEKIEQVIKKFIKDKIE